MAKKNKQQIVFETDITGFKSAIKEGEQSVRSLTKELKLNQEQLKGNKNNTDLLQTRIKTLQKQYDEQTNVIEESNNAYKKAVELLGENSEEARKWKDKIVDAEIKQQQIKNAIDNANEELKKQKDGWITTGKSMQDAGTKIESLGNKINKVGNGLSVISAGIVAIAGAALKASIDYESAFAGVVKTVDGTEEQLNEIKQGILDMSTELPTAATEIASVAESAGQLGIKTEDVLSFTRVMIDLGESTNLSSTEAASSLAKFANVTGMTADKYSNLGSVIVALGNNFATTESDIVAMSTRLAATAELAGLSEPQIMALATSMSSVGIEAEAGGSAMSKLLKSIQVAVETGSDDLNKFAKVAGMSSQDFQKAFKEDAVDALSKFIAGLNDTKRNGKSAVAILDDMGITEVRLSNTILSLANSSDVMTKAIKLANESWKDNTALSKEASTRYKTTESQMKMLKNEATKLAIEFGNELAPSLRELLKDAKPLLTNISDIIKKFSQLDDTTKQNIIRIGALVAAAGPVAKTIGGITSAVGSSISAVGKFTEAIGKANNASKYMSGSATALTTVLKGITSPIGLTTIAVAGLTAACIALMNATDENVKSSQKILEETDKQLESQKELAKSYDDSKNAIFDESDNINKLAEELDTIVDENGKVKESYEMRAQFILNELNKALGTEYSMNNGIIGQYKELKGNIEEVIRLKKINAVVEAEQGKYNEAIQKKAESYQAIVDRTKELAIAQENLKKAQEEAESALKSNVPLDIIKAGNKLDNAKTALTNTQTALNESKQIYNNYLQWIREYENDLVILENGTTEEIEELIVRRTTSYENATDDIASTIQKQIENQLYDLEITKQNLEKSNQIQDEATKKECEIQKKAQETQLTNLANNLAAMVSTTEQMTPAQVEAWKQLATQSFDTYVEVLSKLDDQTIYKIQDAIGGAEQMTPAQVEAWKQLATQSSEKYVSILSNLDDETIYKIQEATDRVVSDETLTEAFKELGRESIDGFSKNNFKEIGQSAVEQVTEGMNSRLGLVGKVRDRMYQIMNQASSMLSANGHADGLAYVPSNNYVARLHEGERVLTKKENQDYTRNFVNNNSRNVTVNIYPQEMTEQEMRKISHYLEREWGRNY